MMIIIIIIIIIVIKLLLELLFVLLLPRMVLQEECRWFAVPARVARPRCVTGGSLDEPFLFCF